MLHHYLSSLRHDPNSPQVEAIGWDTSVSNNTNPRPQFPLPFLDPLRKQHECSSTVRDEEIRELLAQAPLHKACGNDGIPYEALKLCGDVIVPYLTWIFQACIDLRLHHDDFKDTITVVIKKPGKAPEVPTSYRPIAIINTIAKLYERLIASRIKELVVREGLLPDTQFGAPGRSTTNAIQHLTNYIYTGWLKGYKVSLLGLDLSGAYDHVDRSKLLQSLIDKYIPDWLIEVIWSFLSDRRSFIHMPGIDGSEYWIDVGVPQGSPLSSLLFLFYAAPLLADLRKEYPTAMLFSYVDDTYIVVADGSYEKNVKIMAAIHEKLILWASSNNLKFSPTKYHVMHFTDPYLRGKNAKANR